MRCTMRRARRPRHDAVARTDTKYAKLRTPRARPHVVQTCDGVEPASLLPYLRTATKFINEYRSLPLVNSFLRSYASISSRPKCLPNCAAKKARLTFKEEVCE